MDDKMNRKNESQDDRFEYVAMAVPMPVSNYDCDAHHVRPAVQDEIVFNELDLPTLTSYSPRVLPPSAPSPMASEFSRGTENKLSPTTAFHGATAEELRGEQPSWPVAFAAMFVYHVCSFVLAMVSVSLSFMTILPSIILLPFCCLGLVVFRVHVLLGESLLHMEVLLHNWTVSMINRRDLLLGVPPTEFVLFPKEIGVRNQLQQMFCVKTLGKTLYFWVGKFVLMFVHVFAAVWTPVSTLVARMMGAYGFCPAAFVLLKLTRWVVHRFG